MKHVLFIDHSPKFGGAERVLLNLLSRIDKNDISPIIVCRTGSDIIEFFKDRGIKVETTSMPWFSRKARLSELLSYPFYLILFAIFLWKRIKKYEIAIIHANTFIAALYSIIPAWITKRPLVWHMHDILNLDLLNKIFIRLAGWGADNIICVSEAVKRRLVEFGIDAEKSSVIYNFICEPIGLKDASSVTFRKEFNLPDGAPLVGMIGQICKLKGQVVFIEAVSQILSYFPTTRFAIVGDIMHDSERGYKFGMERLIERHNLKERVILTGFRKDVFSILGNLDIIVHASIEPESLGMVILEAMSMEKPVVATNVGGVPELIVDGVNGFLVPPNNPERLAEAVCILLKNPNLMIKMGKEGKRIVSEKFNSDINIEKLNGVYKDLLEK